jgi:hypothetical protein
VTRSHRRRMRSRRSGGRTRLCRSMRLLASQGERVWQL